MLRLEIVFGGNSLDLEGDVTVADAMPVVHVFLAAVCAPLVTQADLDLLDRKADAILSSLAEPAARVTADARLNSSRMRPNHMPATVQELSGELDAIKTAVDAVKVTLQAQIDEIAALKAQLAAGTPVSQEQLDALDAQADSILAALGSNGAPGGGV
jgi:hypothetical protein